MSRRIGVMYLGKLVEIGPSQSILNKPLHPYTQALLKAIPQPVPKRKRDKRAILGEIPSPINPPSGCRFHPRCPIAVDRCKTEVPATRELAPEHFVACHMA
jgi:oligopeptide/dipeptide ABC transporter ATP-binding protein